MNTKLNWMRYINATNIFRRIFGTMTIYPYKEHGIWMFDDPATGLIQEPFIEGIPEIIEFALAKHAKDQGPIIYPYLIDKYARTHGPIFYPENGFKLTFSKWPFPGYQGILRLAEDRKPGEGQWYTLSHEGETMWGWLCPALYCYFGRAPKKIYCRIGEDDGKDANCYFIDDLGHALELAAQEAAAAGQYQPPR